MPVPAELLESMLHPEGKGVLSLTTSMNDRLKVISIGLKEALETGELPVVLTLCGRMMDIEHHIRTYSTGKDRENAQHIYSTAHDAWQHAMSWDYEFLKILAVNMNEFIKNNYH